jgi:flagellar P-ring protein precursor FlgI
MKAIINTFIFFSLLTSWSVNAQRIKDLADVAGVRSNQLIGYGLVVGLPGTGEQSPFTEQSFKTMLSNFGITMPEKLKPKIKNVAAVAVHLLSRGKLLMLPSLAWAVHKVYEEAL